MNREWLLEEIEKSRQVIKKKYDILRKLKQIYENQIAEHLKPLADPLTQALASKQLADNDDDGVRIKSIKGEEEIPSLDPDTISFRMISMMKMSELTKYKTMKRNSTQVRWV